MLLQMITRTILIEDLVEQKPKSISFLREKGIVCILCGEPVWGTLEELAGSKGFTSEQIDKLVSELNSFT